MNDEAIHCQFAQVQNPQYQLELVFRIVDHTLQVYTTSGGYDLQEIELFSSGLEAKASEAGEALLPIRMGLLIPAEGTDSFQLELGTYEYEGLHIAASGLFKSGAALLATWQDPYTRLKLSRELPENELRMSFVLAKTARSIEIHCLGRGDYHTAAEAYRRRADELGYRVPWSEKLSERPQAERLFGACNVKLWTALARRIDENMVEKSVEVKWTFDEAGQIAEHLKNDLKLEDVLFHLGGWSTYGYDCRHPDIMPANTECGGDEGLAMCARRVQDCGYLFCLHDNYQDMYRDAPSWGEEWIQKKPDGSLTKGGVWLGGQAYYTCSREALRLAKRPQNLPRVQEIVHPDLYFIDTTYAVGPQECFDPRHPLTRQEDIFWKIALSDYSRNVFGLFGSECGREWAVPHADFFEGLSSVNGHYYHLLKPEQYQAVVVPFFDMVFHDCIVIHGKYGYNPAEMGEQVIHHASIGRTLYYHNLGSHLYWEEPGAKAEIPVPDEPYDPALYTRAHNGWAEGYCLWDRFMKNTQEILGPLNKRTSQAWIERYEFLDRNRLIRQTTFSNGVTVIVNGSPKIIGVFSPAWGDIQLPPYGLFIEARDFLAFTALSWNGHDYDTPTMFTLTSLDHQALTCSSKFRIFHGFGEIEIPWCGQILKVKDETIFEH